MRFIRKRCGMIGGCVRTSPPALVEIVGSPLQRRAAAYVARSRHSRFAGNHDSPCAIFATPSRNALRRACPSHPRRTPPRVYIGDRVTQPLGLIQFLRSTRGGRRANERFRTLNYYAVEATTVLSHQESPCLASWVNRSGQVARVARVSTSNGRRAAAEAVSRALRRLARASARRGNPGIAR